MQAMILAAGRGERMRPLTDTLPKPLLSVAGKRIIEYTIERLAAVGITSLVINCAWLAHRFAEILGDGSVYGVNIRYSMEQEALETAGGIVQALPMLGEQPFLVVNGDIWSDIDFEPLMQRPMSSLAHIILVPNPQHNPTGDFGCLDGLVTEKSPGESSYTYSGIGIYTPEIFTKLSSGKRALAPILRQLIANQQLSGEIYSGRWSDIGTVERLQQLQQQLQHDCN